MVAEHWHASTVILSTTGSRLRMASFPNSDFGCIAGPQSHVLVAHKHRHVRKSESFMQQKRDWDLLHATNERDGNTFVEPIGKSQLVERLTRITMALISIYSMSPRPMWLMLVTLAVGSPMSKIRDISKT